MPNWVALQLKVTLPLLHLLAQNLYDFAVAAAAASALQQTKNINSFISLHTHTPPQELQKLQATCRRPNICCCCCSTLTISGTAKDTLSIHSHIQTHTHLLWRWGSPENAAVTIISPVISPYLSAFLSFLSWWAATSGSYSEEAGGMKKRETDSVTRRPKLGFHRSIRWERRKDEKRRKREEIAFNWVAREYVWYKVRVCVMIVWCTLDTSDSPIRWGLGVSVFEKEAKK